MQVRRIHILKNFMPLFVTYYQINGSSYSYKNCFSVMLQLCMKKFFQGYGLHTSEELLVGPTGEIITDSIGKYKIPTTDCVPEKFHVALLKNASTKGNVYSSKVRINFTSNCYSYTRQGIGEPPLFLGISAFFAIRDAIKAHRQQNGIVAEDHLLLPSPLTPEVIRLACGDNLTGSFAP